MPVEQGIPDALPTPQQAPAARTSRGEILASIALAVAGFLVTAGALHATLRDPLHLHADMRSEKLALLRQWHGTVFSAAFGTSHIHNGFSPRVFDAVLAGSPAATHTANLAIEGGAQSEQFVMAKEFVTHLESPAQAGAPRQPCLVVLELNAGANFVPAFMMHPRVIDIYDWPTAHLVMQFAGPGMSLGQRYGRIGYALEAAGLHYANVGMLSNKIFAPPLDPAKLAEMTEGDRRGQTEMPYHPAYLPRLYSIVSHERKQPIITPEQTLAGNAEMVRQLALASPVKNLSFVYVVMPKLTDLDAGADYPDHLTVAGPDGPIVVPIINLARADRYPRMYNPEIWYDDAHFDGEGARRITQIFAEELKKWYAAHGGPKPCG
jgi:hypothetical protein